MQVQKIISPIVAISAITLASAGFTACNNNKSEEYANNWKTELKESTDSIKDLKQSGKIPFAEYYISSNRLIDAKTIDNRLAGKFSDSLKAEKESYYKLLETELQTDKQYHQFKIQLLTDGYKWHEPQLCGVYAKILQDIGAEKILFVWPDTQGNGSIAYIKEGKTYYISFNQDAEGVVRGDYDFLSPEDGVRHNPKKFICLTLHNYNAYQTDINFEDGTRKHYEFPEEDVL